jgi:hypothetical protein
MPPIYYPPVAAPPIVIPDPPTVPADKALLIVVVPGEGYKAIVIDKPVPGGPPGNLPPSSQPVRK